MRSRCPVSIDRTGQDIHGEGARIQSHGQVVPVELPGGIRAWSVVGYEAVRRVLGDRRFSKDPRRHWPAYVSGEVGEDFPLIGWVAMENLTTTDGEDHQRLRGLISKAFTPRRVERMRSGIEKITKELIERLETVSPGEVVDLKAEFARLLPAQVICDLFGVPAHARDAMLRGGEVNVDTTITPEEAAANVELWHNEMREFVDSKRRVPGEDLTSDLVAAQENGARLDDAEMVGTLHILLATGTEPVMNLLSNAALALLTRREQLSLVLDGRMSWSDVVEEVLRVEAPVAHLPFRFTTEEVEIAGVTIPRGEPVLINFAAAGRDPDVHGETAAIFDVAREDKHHLSFGHGAHHCIGQALARLEVQIALPALFERFPHMALALPPDEIAPQETFIMNGVRELPVRLDGTGVTMT